MGGGGINEVCDILPAEPAAICANINLEEFGTMKKIFALILALALCCAPAGAVRIVLITDHRVNNLSTATDSTVR